MTAAAKPPAADTGATGRQVRTVDGSRAWISAGDLGLMLKLPAAALLAALLPPARRDAAAGALGGLAGRLGINAGGLQPAKIAALIRGQDVAGAPDAIARGLRRNFRLNQLHFAASWLPGGWPARIRVTGADEVRHALAAGRGAVLWVAPLIFAPLVAKRALHEHGFAVHHLTRPGHGFSRTTFGTAVLNPLRTRIEDRYLAERITIRGEQTAGPVRALARHLAANHVVSVTFTRSGMRVIETPFLAGRLRTAPGAPHLALRAGAPLLPVFALRTGPDQFSVELGPPLATPPGETRERQIQALLAAYASELAARVRRAPDQFLWQDDIVLAVG